MKFTTMIQTNNGPNLAKQRYEEIESGKVQTVSWGTYQTTSIILA